jgi:hypothetical protein
VRTSTIPDRETGSLSVRPVVRHSLVRRVVPRWTARRGDVTSEPAAVRLAPRPAAHTRTATRSHRTGDDTALKSAQSDAAPEIKLDAMHLLPRRSGGIGT